jgi:hypothetical protein
MCSGRRFHELNTMCSQPYSLILRPKTCPGVAIPAALFSQEDGSTTGPFPDIDRSGREGYRRKRNSAPVKSDISSFALDVCEMCFRH